MKPKEVIQKQRPAVDRLPEGATEDDAWTRIVIPTFINLVLSGDKPWIMNEADIIPLLQDVWNHTYGSKIPFKIQKGTVPFELVSKSSIMIQMLECYLWLRLGLSEALPVPEQSCIESHLCHISLFSAQECRRS